MANFSSLDYGYVILAVMKGTDSHKATLHEYESPIALQSSLIANQNRDTKRKKEPYKMEDFSLYKPTVPGVLPRYTFGSAAAVAIQKGLMPPWALFCYKDLASAANADYVPAVSIFVSPHAVLLHPVRGPKGRGWTGMLIAQEDASNKAFTFVDDNGDKYELVVPEIRTKVIAEENVTLFERATIGPS